jgi:hypothetical protein
MKVKVTTEIDFDLKWVFEATRDVHKKSYKEVLETGIVETIKSILTPEAIEARIKYRDQEQEQDRDLLARMRVMGPQQKRIDVYENKEAELENMREELFQKDQPLLKKTWGLSDFYTRKLMDRYEFKSKNEARRWFKPRLDERE